MGLPDLERLAYETKHRILNHAKNLGQPLLEDFGDYIPFLAYLGERDLCAAHLQAISDATCRPVLPVEREDTLLGLIELYRLTADHDALRLAKEYVQYLLTHFYHRGRIGVSKADYVDYVFDARKSLKSGVLRHILRAFHGISGGPVFLPRNGVFIELLTDLYHVTGESDYLETAKDMANRWLEDETFVKYGLFSTFRLNPLGPNHVILSKDNVALINSFVCLYSETRDAAVKNGVNKWFESVRSRCPDGLVPSKLYLGKTPRKEPIQPLAAPIIDTLCDAHHFLGDDEVLSFAEGICDYWMNLQSDQTGLIPADLRSNISYQDVMTDYSVSLWRMHELTGKEVYRESAEKAMRGLFERHAFPLTVDFRTGRVIDSSIVPKFVFLMLKPIILLERRSVYSDEKVYKLLRDR